MNIGDICQRHVVTIDKDASVRDAAQMMRAEHVGDVVVVDATSEHVRPLGIVTDRDLVIEVLAKGVELDSVSVGDLTHSRVITARHDADLYETLRLMSVKGVRRLPVLGGEGQLFGLLSLEDILEVLMKELGYLRELSTRRSQRERALRE